uniref:Uncharacterized protein n=1 Tax=Romanomermis culicivorax TaxID=13658 RepID=A0A915J6J5_ROMCU
MCLKYILLISVTLYSGIICDQEPHNEQLHLESFLWDESRFMFRRNMTSGDKCVVDCMQNSSIPKTVMQFFRNVTDDVFKRQNSTNIRRIFNATMLDWYCGYANGRHQCISECDSNSVLKTEILKLLRPMSYICNETDFIAHSKCYRQVYEDDVDECESGDKCLPYKTTMIKYVHERRRGIQNSSIEDAVQFVLNNLCQYIICGNQCRTNELSTQCGEEANQVLIEFYRRIVSSLKQIITELYRWFYGGRKLILTDICDDI